MIVPVFFSRQRERAIKYFAANNKTLLFCCCAVKAHETSMSVTSPLLLISVVTETIVSLCDSESL